MLTHAEIIVGAPDHDVALALWRMPDCVREAPGDAFEISEDAVAPLIMETTEGGTEKLAVIHRKTWNRRAFGLFLERFQLGCLCEIPHFAMTYAHSSRPLLLR
jgi:hypothetical protein